MNLPHDQQRWRRGLQFLAVLQALAIATMAVLLLGSEATPPAAGAVSRVANPPVAPAAATAAAQPTSAEAPPLASHSAAAPPVVDTVMYGRVVDEAGNPVTEGVVTFRRPDATTDLARLDLLGQHTEFAIPGLLPGPLECTGRANGFCELHQTIDIPAGAAHWRHDVVLQRTWILTVKLQTPEGKPLHLALQELQKQRPGLRRVEVAAMATPWPPGAELPPWLRPEYLRTARWESATGVGAMLRGGAQQPRDVSGTLQIDRAMPLWISAVLQQRVLASTEVQPGQKEVVITVPVEAVLQELGQLRARLVDGDGAPLAKVTFTCGDGQATSDEQGVVLVQDVKPGTLSLSAFAHAARLRLPSAKVQLAAGQQLDLGDLQLLAGREFKGRCEGGTGERAWLTVTALDPATNPQLQPGEQLVQVASDGGFTLSLCEGRYRLRASGAGHVDQVIDTRALGAEPLVLKLQAEAALRIDVQPGSEAWLMTMFDGSRQVLRRALVGGSKFPIMMLPGSYRLELQDRHGKTQTRQIELGAAGLHLRLP